MRRGAFALATSIILVALAGCGGDDDGATAQGAGPSSGGSAGSTLSSGGSAGQAAGGSAAGGEAAGGNAAGGEAAGGNAAGGEAAGGNAAGGEAAGGMAPAVGTTELFASLPGNGEGIGLAKGPTGEPALFAGARLADTVHRIDPDGTVTKHADVPGPLGMAANGAGDLLICGKGPGDIGKSDKPGVIWKVTPNGEATVLVGPGEHTFKLTNMVAVAPDERIVFTDSGAGRVYRADADGSNVILLSTEIPYPNGMAFSPDGSALYVASYDTKKIYSLARAADGSFGAPEVYLDNAENADGVSVLATGELLLVQTGLGVVRYSKAGEATVVSPVSNFKLPANGAFGAGPYGDKWFYVVGLFTKDIMRVYVGEPGVSLLKQ